MLVEPSGPDVPARVGLTEPGEPAAAPPGLLDAPLEWIPGPMLIGALVAAALVGPVAGRGALVLVAGLVGLATGARTGLVAVGLAGAATGIRWGTGAFEAVIGAQQVVGPAATTGATAAIGSSILAASAVLLAARTPLPVPGAWATAVPAGVLAGGVAFGGSPDADLLVRAVAAVAGAGLAIGIARLRAREERLDHIAGWVAVTLGASAVVAALV